MKIDNSILCDLCLERCSITVKRLFRGEEEQILQNYITTTEHKRDYPPAEVHYCAYCMQLMRGAAAKILLARLEKKVGK